jgi:hypothetical protein
VKSFIVYIIGVIQNRLRVASDTTREMRNAYRILVRKPGGGGNIRDAGMLS